MEYENQEWEISLKDMLFSVLYQWKKIIVFALVFAILLGGLKAFLEYKGNITEQQTEEGTIVALTEQEKYDNQKKLLEHRIDEYESMITVQNKYMMESALMQIDFHRSYEASASLYVSSDYQIMPGMIYQNENYSSAIMAYYCSLLNDNMALEEIAEEFNMDVRYLRELISVSVDANYIRIVVWHSRMETAEQIMERLIDSIKDAQSTVKKTIGAHSVEVLMQSTYEYTGNEISEKQRDEEERLVELETMLENAENELSGLVAPETAVVSCVKWTILGCIAGGVLSVMWFCVAFLFGNKVNSAEELKRRLGVKILGNTMQEKEKNCKIDSFLRRMDGRMTENTDANYALIGERILTCIEDNKTALISGNIENEETQKLISQLRKNTVGAELIECGSILKNADAVRNLRENRNVILVEVCGLSSYKQIIKELEMIREANAELIGCIVVE